jgi:ribonuclease HI
MATKLQDATNNLAEFKALEAALLDAVRCKITVLLIVTDSQMVFGFLIDANDIHPPHLKQIITTIKGLYQHLKLIYVSKVFSHRKDTVLGNQIADALCTWALKSNKDNALHLQLQHHTLASRLLTLNKSSSLPTNITQVCNICLKEKDHNQSECPLFKFKHATKFYG